MSNRGITVRFMIVLGLFLGYGSGRTEGHVFRHQQHYSHRIEQAVNDFKTSQVLRNASQVRLRHHTTGGETIFVQSTTPAATAAAAAAPPPRKHHLRHHNQHHQAWEQRVFPSLKSQSQSQTTVAPPGIKTKTNGANLTSVLQSRYSYHDGLHDTTRTKSTYLATSGSKPREMQGRRPTAGRRKMHPSLNLHREDIEQIAQKGLSGSAKRKESKSLEDLSAGGVDDYYSEDEGTEDSDYSSYEDEDVDVYDEPRNKITDRGGGILKRRTGNIDVEDIYSRSYVPGTLTRHKFEMLGTHDAVKQSRNSLITNQKQHRVLANAHASKIYIEATCRTPKPRVEKIQKDPSKVYVPHCTILHRCGDDTGCCTTDTQTCVPKSAENVDLYFFVKSIKSKHGTIERLTFVNHTECHCVNKSKRPNYREPALLKKATILNCNCPRLFEKVLQEDGFCRCDCSSGNSGCDWLKRGMEHFSVVDRKCISDGRCKLPTCEYGTYVKRQGRCPRRDDKLSYSMSFR